MPGVQMVARHTQTTGPCVQSRRKCGVTLIPALGLNNKYGLMKTRKEVFLDEMNEVVPWVLPPTSN